MILPLQRRHRLVWSLLAILLPIGFVSAYWAIREVSLDNNVENKTIEGDIFNEREDDFFKIIERKEELEDTTLYHLIIEVKQPIRQSATVVYISETNDIENGVVIGQLSSKGLYSYPIQDPLQTNDNVLFYNPITKKVFHLIKNND